MSLNCSRSNYHVYSSIASGDKICWIDYWYSRSGTGSSIDRKQILATDQSECINARSNWYHPSHHSLLGVSLLYDSNFQRSCGRFCFFSHHMAIIFIPKISGTVSFYLIVGADANNRTAISSKTIVAAGLTDGINCIRMY